MQPKCESQRPGRWTCHSARVIKVYIVSESVLLSVRPLKSWVSCGTSCHFRCDGCRCRNRKGQVDRWSRRETFSKCIIEVFCGYLVQGGNRLCILVLCDRIT